MPTESTDLKGIDEMTFHFPLALHSARAADGVPSINNIASAYHVHIAPSYLFPLC